MKDLNKATIIDGVATTEDRDNQDEILMLSGADIGDMAARGYFNDNHGTGFVNTLGRITHARKIFKKEDAKDGREAQYWDRMQRPFLYVKGYLFDEGEHPNAKAVASIMKEFKKMGTPLDVQMSVEGKIVKREPNGKIARSMIRNVALTLVPANTNTGAQVVNEEARQAVLTKCREAGTTEDYANTLLKSLQGTPDISIRKGFIELPDEKDGEIAKLKHVEDNIKKAQKMIKMLSAGNAGAAAPSNRVGGGTLMSEKKAEDVKSVGPELKREKRKKVLKSLIQKIKDQNPGLSLEKAVQLASEVFRKKMQ